MLRVLPLNHVSNKISLGLIIIIFYYFTTHVRFIDISEYRTTEFMGVLISKYFSNSSLFPQDLIEDLFSLRWIQYMTR